MTHRLTVALLAILLAVGQAAPVWAATAVEVVGQDLTRTERLHLFHELAVRPDVPAKIVVVSRAHEAAAMRGIAPPDTVPARDVVAISMTPQRVGYGIHVWTRNLVGVTPAMYADALTTAGVVDVAIRAYAAHPVNGTAALADMIWGYEGATAAVIPPHQVRTALSELVLTESLIHAQGHDKAVLETIRSVKEQVSQDHLHNAAAIRARIRQTARRHHLTLTAAQVDRISAVMVRIARLKLSSAQLHQQVAGLRHEAAQASRFWHRAVAVWHFILRHVFGGSGHAAPERIDGPRSRSIDSNHSREILVRP